MAAGMDTSSLPERAAPPKAGLVIHPVEYADPPPGERPETEERADTSSPPRWCGLAWRPGRTSRNRLAAASDGPVLSDASLPESQS